MEKESSPVAEEDKYVQRFSVKRIFTYRKFAFKKTISGVNDTWPSISLRKGQTLTQWNSVDKLKGWLLEQREAFLFLSWLITERKVYALGTVKLTFEVDYLLFTNFLINGLARFKSQTSLKMLFSQKKKKKKA